MIKTYLYILFALIAAATLLLTATCLNNELESSAQTADTAADKVQVTFALNLEGESISTKTRTISDGSTIGQSYTFDDDGSGSAGYGIVLAGDTEGEAYDDALILSLSSATYTLSARAAAVKVDPYNGATLEDSEVTGHRSPPFHNKKGLFAPNIVKRAISCKDFLEKYGETENSH